MENTRPPLARVSLATRSIPSKTYCLPRRNPYLASLGRGSGITQGLLGGLEILGTRETQKWSSDVQNRVSRRTVRDLLQNR